MTLLDSQPRTDPSTDASIDYVASTGVTFRRESAPHLYSAHQPSTFGNIKKDSNLSGGI
jgi:hypothetical protein